MFLFFFLLVCSVMVIHLLGLVRRRTRYRHRHTGMDHVASRVRRSRHGAAVTLVYCGSLASVHSHKPASTSRVSAPCSSPLLMVFSGPSRPQPLWRVHRSWSLLVPTEFRTPVSHEIVLSVAVSAWLQNVRELSLF